MERGMTMLMPAADWREALPCGNGSLCALVYGSISPETILFNYDRLWYGGKVTPLPDMTGALEEVRALGRAGDLKGANQLIADRLLEQGFHGLVPTFHPACDLKIRCEQSVAFTDYCRKLDYNTGEASVTWNEGTIRHRRRYFVSRADNIAMMCFDAKKGRLHPSFQLCEHDLTDSVGMDGQPKEPPLTYRSWSEGDKLFLSVVGSDGGEYGAVMKIITDGHVSAGEDVTWADQLSSLPHLWGLPLEKRTVMVVRDARAVTVMVGFYANSADGNGERHRLCHRLDALNPNYDALFESHCQKHSALFGRLRIELDDGEPISDEDSFTNERLLQRAYRGETPAALVTRLFDYGRYLLLCCSGDGSLPPTLQGSFNGDYFPPWNSFYVHNENTQMYYWQALGGRMPEVMESMFRYFEGFIEDYRVNARRLFGCRGIFIPLVGAANTGLLQDPQSHVIHFTGCAAWIAAHFYDYYVYTGDETFLRERALPFMQEAAWFYENYLQMDDDGLYTIFPSNSPENSPKNSVGANEDLATVMNPGIPTTYNSTVDTALVKELLSNLVDAYRQLGIREDQQKQYERMLAHLRPYRINEDGALAEWIPTQHTDNYAHRHLSHIYPFFPGNEIRRTEEPALYEAVRCAVDNRLKVGIASQTGWSLVHLANIYARLEDADSAMNCLDIMARTCIGRNLFGYHNDYRNMGATLKLSLGRGAPFQIDGNMGYTAALMEMILYSDREGIRLLPAMPVRFLKGRAQTLSARCGCDVVLVWDRGIGAVTATITARATRTIRVTMPDGYRVDGRQVIHLDMEKGKVYSVRAIKAVF